MSTIQYRRGMPYGEFLRMMEQRRAADTRPRACDHPFLDVKRDVREERCAAGVVITIEYTCTACDTAIDLDARGIKS